MSVAGLDDLLGVEADGGLVEDQHGRVADEGLRHADALLVALGEVLHQPAAHVGELQHLHGPVHRLRARGARDALDLGDEGEVFPHGHVGVERRQLGHVADAPLHLVRLLEDVVAVHLHAIPPWRRGSR